MNASKTAQHIRTWLNDYLQHSNCSGFVVGVSGGIDSAVVSTLCTQTERKTILVSLPIGHNASGNERANKHIDWLSQKYSNVHHYSVELSKTLNVLSESLPFDIKQNPLILANTQSRLRMTTLYAIAQHQNCLVVGTGNKIEDFGIGFFTKYGDGGVDISPIADLLKSEVFQLGSYLKIIPEILTAAPTDGLFDDHRTDEAQIGASYPELEWAMNFQGDSDTLSQRQKNVLKIFHDRQQQNAHKMTPIPVCKIPQ